MNTRNIWLDGKVVGRVTKLDIGGYVPHLTQDLPRTSPQVVCSTWTEARETVLGIYR